MMKICKLNKLMRRKSRKKTKTTFKYSGVDFTVQLFGTEDCQLSSIILLPTPKY